MSVKDEYIRIVLCRKAGEYLSEKDTFLPMAAIRETVDYVVEILLYRCIDRKVKRYIEGDYVITDEEMQFLLADEVEEDA